MRGDGYSFPLDDNDIPQDWFDDDTYQLPDQDWPPAGEEFEPVYRLKDDETSNYTDEWVKEWAWSGAPLPTARCGYCAARDGQCSH